MMRKSVRLFLGLLLAAALIIPCLAFADGWRHTEAANGVEITGYSGTEQDVEIPAQTGNGRKVVAIGERIFAGCEQRIRAIIIPESVITIDANAFEGREDATLVVVPGSMAEAYAKENKFKYMSPQDWIDFGSAEALSEEAGAATERNPESAESVEESEERNPESAESIETDTPETEPSLIEGDSEAWDFDKKGEAFILTAYLGEETETLQFPQAVKGIPVTGIGPDVLGEKRGSVRSILVPEGIKTIAAQAFANCEALTSVALPASLESIGDGAFAGCYALSEIEIPAGVTQIGVNPFARCASLSQIPVSPDNATFRFENGLLLKAETVSSNDPDAPKERITVVAAVPALEEAIFPENTVAIAENAFLGCYQLTAVTIPEGVTAIGPKAFYGCVALTEVFIPDGVDDIGTQAFASCFALPMSGVSIAEGQPMADDAFADCADSGEMNVRKPEAEIATATDLPAATPTDLALPTDTDL